MKDKSLNTRREALKSLTLGASASLLLGTRAHGVAPTPSQTEGPFYPDIDNDLTFVSSRDHRAKGDYLYIHGTVTDTEGKPIPRALVEIWQTDHQGIYDHAGDPNHKDKDPNFQSFGRCVTDEQGRYCFKTIRPRYYGVGNTYRTPHIHYKVWRRGFHELTTQMYFEGEPRNPEDGIYNQLSKEEQKLVTIAFQDAGGMPPELAARVKKEFKEDQPAAGAQFGQFDLALRIV